MIQYIISSEFEGIGDKYLNIFILGAEKDVFCSKTRPVIFFSVLAL